MASSSSSSSRKIPLLVAAVVLAAALASAAAAAAAAGGGEYCMDTLRPLLACREFMLDGAPAASRECCDAYGAAFTADPFCLCYVADGRFGRATGYDGLNVTRALEIPTNCGQVAPPIQLCNRLVLPPYEPQSAADAPSSSAAQPPSGSGAPPSFTSPPPPPPSISGGHRDSLVKPVHLAALGLVLVLAACG